MKCLLSIQAADEWSFDVFALNVLSPNKVLRNLSAELLNRYGLVHKFKVCVARDGHSGDDESESDDSFCLLFFFFLPHCRFPAASWTAFSLQ